MIVNPTLQTLMKEFGSELGVGDLALDGNGACALRIDKDMRVDFQYRPDREHLVVYADLGLPPERPLVHLELLRANLFWNATQGATLSLSNETPPHVVLAISEDWRTLRLVTLKDLVERFVSTAEDWKDMLHAPANHDGAGATTAADFGAMALKV